jgi:hypothetical protein
VQPLYGIGQTHTRITRERWLFCPFRTVRICYGKPDVSVAYVKRQFYINSLIECVTRMFESIFHEHDKHQWRYFDGGILYRVDVLFQLEAVAASDLLKGDIVQ